MGLYSTRGRVMVALALSGAVALPLAAAEPTAEEWSYLQKVNAVGKVGEQLHRVTGNNGWANRELMAYARDLTRFNAAQVRRWKAPDPEMESAHRQLIHVLDLSAQHYEALARGNFGDAEARGERLQREYGRFMREWESVMKRFQETR